MSSAIWCLSIVVPQSRSLLSERQRRRRLAGQDPTNFLSSMKHGRCVSRTRKSRACGKYSASLRNIFIRFTSQNTAPETEIRVFQTEQRLTVGSGPPSAPEMQRRSSGLLVLGQPVLQSGETVYLMQQARARSRRLLRCVLQCPLKPFASAQQYFVHI
jgi:hypothetical protein